MQKKAKNRNEHSDSLLYHDNRWITITRCLVLCCSPHHFPTPVHARNASDGASTHWAGLLPLTLAKMALTYVKLRT